MSNHTREIESRGATVDAAIEAGLARLGADIDDVEITVLDEGSRGLLGLGARDAVVVLKTSAETQPHSQPEPVIAQEPTPVVEPIVVEEEADFDDEDEVEDVEDIDDDERYFGDEDDDFDDDLDEEEDDVEDEEDLDEADFDDEEDDEDEEEDEPEDDSDADEGYTLDGEADIASDIIRTMLEKMDVSAEVSVEQTEPDDVTGRRVNVVNIEGEDLSILIGPRGETLDALQFISRLMVGHRMRERAQFVVDVEGHRARREQALSRMAERTAQKAIKRQSPVTLEPMPAYERRIIHMTLRDSAEVYTESVGEGSRRRVRVFPK